MKCDFCGSEENKKIFDYARYQKATILQCQQCELVFLENSYSEHEIQDFYRNQYRNLATAPTETPNEHYHSSSVINDVHNRIVWIKRFVDLKNIRVLEVGSASGRMLHSLREEGVEAHGIELTQSYIEYSKNLDLSVYDRPITELHFKNEFDLIISFHCVEHIPYPKKTFQAIQEALKPGGRSLFMGEVPNQDDWRIQIFNNTAVKRFHYDPCHYYYYSPQTLRAYLEATGFEVKNLETVERYDSLKQLKRILTREYDSDQIEEVLNRDVFADSNENVQLHQNYDNLSKHFNPIFETGVNSKLMGNCLRWITFKR